MTAPELRGALDGLKVLDDSDLARYKAAVAAGEQVGWGYYFPYLLSRNRADRSVVLLGQDDDTQCVFLWRLRDGEAKLDLPVAPTPMNGRVLERCLERANDFNGDTSARILRIDAKDSEAVAAIRGLRVKERKSQYLYSPEAFADIGGRKYRTLRRNVVRVEALPGLEVEPYSPSHAPACHELLRSWGSHHREAHGTAGGIGGSRRVIDLASQLSQPDVRGEVVFLDGRLCAFAFGGEIRPGVGCFFDAKSDTEIPGLSYFHRYSFLSKLTEFSLVNDGSDVGRAGLRQLKDSLRPVEMHIEYRGTQTRD